ncbi:hypothetical protein [Dubosiella newyorkensis]|uniref:hypothetical protein n=1 Tax=Dubosiella newyorkensis TaxID=1862672 RepID=UPI003F6689A5
MNNRDLRDFSVKHRTSLQLRDKSRHPRSVCDPASDSKRTNHKLKQNYVDACYWRNI